MTRCCERATPLDEIMRVAPDFPGALGAHTVATSEVLLDQGDVAAAIAHAQRVTKLAPSLPEAWSVLAFSRHAGGDHAGELSAIDRRRAIAPSFPGIDRVRAIAACEASRGTDCTPESSPNAEGPH